MSANDFLSKTTPAPPPPPPVKPPSEVDAWIGVIIFALVVVGLLAAAGYFYKYKSEKNEKFVQELRKNLQENLEREPIQPYPDPPYTLRIDPSRMPVTKLPDPVSIGGGRGSRSNHNHSTGRKRSNNNSMKKRR